MSRWSDRTRGRQWNRRFSSAIALLFPGIAVVVIPAHLPVPRLVLGAEADPSEPLGALPEVEVRHQGPHRRAMLVRQGVAVQAVGNEDGGPQRLLDRDV